MDLCYSLPAMATSNHLHLHTIRRAWGPHAATGTDRHGHKAARYSRLRVQHRHIQADGPVHSTLRHYTTHHLGDLLLAIGTSAAWWFIQESLSERRDLAAQNGQNPGEQPRIEVLLRQRELQSDTHRTLSVL